MGRGLRRHRADHARGGRRLPWSRPPA